MDKKPPEPFRPSTTGDPILSAVEAIDYSRKLRREFPEKQSIATRDSMRWRKVIIGGFLLVVLVALGLLLYLER